jgi:peptide chain release factor 2
MRERQELDEAVTAIKKLERDLEDGATLIELG